MHPLYPVAKRCVGQYVYCHHMSGRTYRGILQSVNPNGIYLMQSQGIHPVGSDGSEHRVDLSVDSTEELDPTLVFFPAAFFAFGALAGLGLGYAAGSRPYYGYPY